MTRMVVALLALAFLAAPLAADAQHAAKVHRIGVLSPGNPDVAARGVFVRRLNELGWVAGQNFAFESRYAEGDLARLPDLAAELIQLKVSVILAFGTPRRSRPSGRLARSQS